ncbi:MAG: heat-inducible transcriptional repressor HrcA [Pseudomonadota bacterium]|nr:heat-inducible transcriptional repressor HrcA [Pseudomonadota bacterium]
MKLTTKSSLHSLDERSREVFRSLVELYIETGEPTGSRTIAKNLSEQLSAATVRNVMQDLEQLGLLGSPHTSAGRVPTETGLRLFVDGLLEINDMNNDVQAQIEKSVKGDEIALTSILDRVGSILSGLTKGASLVMTPKIEAPIKHLEFVSLSKNKALVVLVTADGQVENRIFSPPVGLSPASMSEAGNFLNHILRGHTISEIKAVVAREIESHKAELNSLTFELIESGSAVWIPDNISGRDRLIVRGRANLLEEDVSNDDLERIRNLFDDLERKRDLEQLLDLTQEGEGVRIFIGSENKLFSLSGSTLVISPYMNSEKKIIGAVGVIGPTRLNYGRIVPIVDYTAQFIGKTIARRSG